MDHDNKKCCALIIKNGGHQQCSFKKRIGDFCEKHHNKKKVNKVIRIDDYNRILSLPKVNAKIITFQDYLDDKKLIKYKTIDIYKTLKLNDSSLNCNMWIPLKLRNHLINFYDNFIKTRKYIDVIVKIQQSFRQRCNLKLLIKHGPCYFDRNMCNNAEDFYTLDQINEIPQRFFFSFKDQNKFYYGYDIRSLAILIEQYNNNINNPTNRKISNPYTTNIFHVKDINRMNVLIKELKIKGYILTINPEKELTEGQKIKQSIIKVFSLIDQLGYQTDVEWLLAMNLRDLKGLYRLLEDIWNYRSELTSESKKEIIPTEDINPLFGKSIQYIINCNSITEVLKNILDVFERLVTESTSLSSRSLGALYVLTSLVGISQPAALSYPDLVQTDDNNSDYYY
uniref:Uncharacterized protein n=1 Tax=viral metagenome TaxID=1070528 RepID=A0A6C0E7I0_9ZZZZ